MLGLTNVVLKAMIRAEMHKYQQTQGAVLNEKDKELESLELRNKKNHHVFSTVQDLSL